MASSDASQRHSFLPRIVVMLRAMANDFWHSNLCCFYQLDETSNVSEHVALPLKPLIPLVTPIVLINRNPSLALRCDVCPERPPETRDWCGVSVTDG